MKLLFNYTQKLCEDSFFDGDQRKHDPKASPSFSLFLEPRSKAQSKFLVKNKYFPREPPISKGFILKHRSKSGARNQS